MKTTYLGFIGQEGNVDLLQSFDKFGDWMLAQVIEKLFSTGFSEVDMAALILGTTSRGKVIHNPTD